MYFRWSGKREEIKQKLTDVFGIAGHSLSDEHIRYSISEHVYIDLFSNGIIKVFPPNKDISTKLQLILFHEIYVDQQGNKVFVLHGHDEKSRLELRDLLISFGFAPFSIINNIVGSSTVIETLEQEAKTSHFAVVLMTPDDMGYGKVDGVEFIKARARQNVIFEAGLLLGILGRDRVAILKKADTEMPSDAYGILYIAYGDSVKEDHVQERLRLHLMDAGLLAKKPKS